MKNFYESDFCALIFFFPKTFIHEVVFEYQIDLKRFKRRKPVEFHVLPINIDINLKLFFETVATYFSQDLSPSVHLLKLKFKELVLQILTTDYNTPLKKYFLSTLKKVKKTLNQ
jgi:AraC family transcriptional regulator, exoenzyme S synthesis regulatory protein ExsA